MFAWRGLDSVTRADSHLQASSEQSDGLLWALNQLQRDVEMRAGVELTEPKKVGVDDEPPSAPPALTVRSSDSKGFRLDIIRTAADQPGALQRVRWWVKGDTLYRAVAEARSRYPLPAPGNGVAVLSDVSDVQVRVWEVDKGWRQLSGNRREDPLGLEIRLSRGTAQGVEKYRQVIGPLD